MFNADKKIYGVILFLLFPVIAFLGFNKHSRSEAFTYHDVIWADAAGYYVYLPLWFIYGNQPSPELEALAQKTGDGFSVKAESGYVFTKYPCGVALLQSPFFLLSHAFAKLKGDNATGFSDIYRSGIILAAAVYGFAGLLLLILSLNKIFDELTSILTAGTLFFGTNLLYYITDASGMPHVYGFFLFAFIIFATLKLIQTSEGLWRILMLACIALAVLVRPTNMLFLLFPLFYKTGNLKEILLRIKLLAGTKLQMIVATGLALLIFMPQLLYWYSISGKPLFYSYQSEGFINALSPKIGHLLFSTNNGLFTYAPVLLLSLAGAVMMLRKKAESARLFPLFFLLTVYVFSSWWAWWFGCSYGCRPFIDFYPVFAIPVAYFFNNIRKSKVLFSATVAFIVLCIVVNLDMIYYYDGCFYGGNWDIQAYLKLLEN